MNCSFRFSSLCKYYKIAFALSCINVMPMFIKLLQYRSHYHLFCPRKFSPTKLKSYNFPQQLMSSCLKRTEQTNVTDKNIRKNFYFVNPFSF